MRDLKTVFQQQIQLRWGSLSSNNNAFNAFYEIVNQIVNQINYGLIKEDNFIINLSNNGQAIMIF